MTVNLYRLSEPKHVNALLMAYIPSERLLIEADAYNQNSTVQPFSPNLIDAVKQLNLAVDRVVPIHGALTPYPEVVKSMPAIASTPTR
jgi:hypothetical protein